MAKVLYKIPVELSLKCIQKCILCSIEFQSMNTRTYFLTSIILDAKHEKSLEQPKFYLFVPESFKLQQAYTLGWKQKKYRLFPAIISCLVSKLIYVRNYGESSYLAL